MRKRMGKAAVSLVLAAAMAVWTPPAGGASLAASGGTASEGNLGGVSFSGTASEGNREGAVSGGTSMEGELPEEGAVDGAPGKGTAAERGVPGGASAGAEESGEASGESVSGDALGNEGNQPGGPAEGEGSWGETSGNVGNEPGEAAEGEGAGESPEKGEATDKAPAAGEDGSGEASGDEGNQPGGSAEGEGGSGEASGDEGNQLGGSVEGEGEGSSGEASESAGNEPGDSAEGEGAEEKPGKEDSDSSSLDEGSADGTSGSGEASDKPSADMTLPDGPEGDAAMDGALPEGLPGDGELSGALSAEKASAADSKGVAYETVGDYAYNIYANGQPLLLVAGEQAGYAKLYVDSNRNGIGEDEEEITSFQGDGQPNGIPYSEQSGYFLANSSIYGGAKEGTCQYDTYVMLAGSSFEPDADNPAYTVWGIYGGNAGGTLTGSTNVTLSGGNVRNIYGGNQEGVLTGDTHVAISGGTVQYVLGGGRSGQVNGNTSIWVTGGSVANGICGGLAEGTLGGNTSIHIENAQVESVYGGNEYSGMVGGNTELFFGDGAVVNGWTYGGGAGRNADISTEVAGSTNITIDGGRFLHNIYGGGGWRGAKVGSSNITVNGGDLAGVWVYGGGEEASEVTGTASIAIQGGTVGTVCASGAGFNNTEAVVGAADIRLLGGTVGGFRALDNDRLSIQGDLSVMVSGDSFANMGLYFGESGYKAFRTVSVTLKDGKAASLRIASKVEDKLEITFENASVGSLELAEGVLADAQESTLSYIGCGSGAGGWGTWGGDFIGPNSFIAGDNPLLWGSRLNKNRFKQVTFRDSYVDYYDDSTVGNENGPTACAQKLVLDGGALRLTGSMLTYMPQTELLHEPLLIRSSSNWAGIHFRENPTGQARIQWMATNGTETPESVGWGLAETPKDGPEELFLPAAEGYAVVYEMAHRGGSDGNIWDGRSWKTDLTENLCRCQVISSSLKETVFPLTESGGATVTLEDVREGSAAGSQNCPIFTHRDTASVFTYTLLEEGTTAPGAALEGNSLTAEGPGTAHVEIRQELNGKTNAYDAFVDFIRVPEKDCYIFAQGMTEDISFALEGAAFNENRSYIWNQSDQPQHGYVDWNMYTKTLEDSALRFDFSREYYNELPVGEYSFQATAYFQSGSGRERLYVYEFTIKIVLPTEVENPDIRLSESRFHYDGTAKEPSVVVMDGDTVIPETEYTVTYRDNVDVGTASVIVTNRPGGLYIVNGSSTFDIVNEYQPQKGRDYLASTTGDGWTQEDFVVSAGEGHLLSLGNTATDDWVGELRRTEETGQGSLTFYVKDKETGRISLAATEAYRIDRTAPETFDIRFDGASVRRIPTAVSFSRFSRKEIAVSIMAADSLSGVGSIAYYQSGSILTEAQLRDVEDWIPGDRFIIAPGDGRRLVVYVRAVDLAGNAMYYASEGVKFDLTPPAVSGVRPGAIYYTTRTAAVTDSNPGPITLNGEAVPDRLTLPGNREAAYVIKAVDLAGNMTVVTVTMKPISALAESIEGLTEENVTSEDAQALDLIRAVEADCGAATREEKEELQEILDACQRLQARIDGAQDGLADVEGTVEGISKDTVRLTDQENLEKAEKELESLLEEYGGNYTEAEKLSIEADLNRIAEALESIGKVLETADAIAKLPDPEDVSPDDYAADSAAAQVERALESLTEHEKSMVDTEKLEQVLAALADYRILEGDGSQWIQETEGGITFRVNGAVEKFTALLVDGEEVDPEQYTVKSGSTILTLKQSYLDTLPVGTHSLTVLYLNGSASGEFEIQTKDGGTAEPDDGTEGDRPGGDEPGTDSPGGDEPGTDEPGGGSPGGDEPGGDGPGTDRPGADSGSGSGDGGRKENGDGKMLSPATGQ
ncbi:MAG: hypothetical protein HFH98_00645 [Lachnospiraceae bacterium]|nr:hypothetical protein [Lachnospiraceae bacterium]